MMMMMMMMMMMGLHECSPLYEQVTLKWIGLESFLQGLLGPPIYP